MVEFTEEQELEIQKRIEEAKAFEDERLSYDQALRYVVPYLQSITDEYDPQTNKLVKRGAIDSYAYRVFMKKCMETYNKYFPPTEPVKDDSVKE